MGDSRCRRVIGALAVCPRCIACGDSDVVHAAETAGIAHTATDAAAYPAGIAHAATDTGGRTTAAASPLRHGNRGNHRRGGKHTQSYFANHCV
jgi:hypothetical protein